MRSGVGRGQERTVARRVDALAGRSRHHPRYGQSLDPPGCTLRKFATCGFRAPWIRLSKALPPARRKRKRPDRGAPEPEKQESPTTDHKQVAETEGPPSRDAGANEEVETEDNASGCLDQESPGPPDGPVEPKPEKQDGLTTAENPQGRNGQHQMSPVQAPEKADKAETEDAASLPPDGEVGASNDNPLLPAEIKMRQPAKEPVEAEGDDGGRPSTCPHGGAGCAGDRAAASGAASDQGPAG